MPRKVKTAFTGDADDRPRAHRHPRHRVHRARARRRARASRSASAAARRSCRASPRRSTSSSRPTTATYLKVAEAVFRIFDRQDWLRVNRARARIKVFVDKFGIDELRTPGRGGAQGRLGRRARLHARPLRARRGGARCRRRARSYASPERRPRGVRALRRSRTSSRRSRTATARSRSHVYRGDLTPEQFRGLAADHARLLRRLRPHDGAPELPAALGAATTRSTRCGRG